LAISIDKFSLHALPPLRGSGELQTRDRHKHRSLDLVKHGFQSLHSEKPPSTVNTFCLIVFYRKKENNSTIILGILTEGQEFI
jgi:hypothetical protein